MPTPALADHRVTSVPERAFYWPEFITPERETYLMHEIGKISLYQWQNLAHRRLLNFGSMSDQARGWLCPTPIPAWLQGHIGDLMAEGVFEPDHRPNNVLLNEYLPGQGIMPHFDGDRYHPVIATISLGSHTVLNFYRDFDPAQADNALSHRRVCSLHVQPRSLLVLTRDMYTQYLHGIEERDQDDLALVANPPAPTGQPLDSARGTRYSLTIRQKLPRP